MKLVQDHAQGVHVRARVDVVDARLGLFRRHVLGSAHHLQPRRHDRLVRQRACQRLGDAKVDHLGRVPILKIGHEHVRRLQVAVHHALVVRMLHRLADGDEELEPRARGEPVFIAIVRDRGPAHQLHHEVRAAALRDTAVEDPRDARMVHQRERLPLRLETRHDLPRFHVPMQQFECHPPNHGLALFRLPNRAEATLPELLQQPIPADHASVRRALRV